MTAPALLRVTTPARLRTWLVRRQRLEGLTRELARLRWLAIVAPIVFLTVVAYLVRGPFHEELHSFPGFLYVILVLAAGVAAFSFLIFALIGSIERQLVERNRQLESVLAVGRAASSSLRLADMLDAALGAILTVTSAEMAEVWLLQGGELVLERQLGLGEEATRERTRLSLGDDLLGVAVVTGRPLVVSDVRVEPHFLRTGLVEMGFRSFGAFPLVSKGEIVGVLGVAARDREVLAGDVERRLLEGIGERVAVAIENVRLHDRVLDAAVLEERERLARELHDSLAQVLGYVNTQTLAIKQLLRSGKREEAEAEVAEMEQAARHVYTDVREAILGLRTSSEGLLDSVRLYVKQLERLSNVEVELEVDERVAGLSLPASTEIQLVRIVQEALANVRKHARARHAQVTIALRDGKLDLAVSDDGQGFELDRRRPTGWPHFGLQTMRERAEAVGGRLDLNSSPKGTKILVHIPLPDPLGSTDARPAC